MSLLKRWSDPLEIPYIVGQEYNRKKDLHGQFGGSHQSGMCPSGSHPIILLFTGPGGEQHGYHDRFVDGIFHYTGEGQSGDMQFTRGNKALRDHIKEKRHVLLFEQSNPGYCRYRGEYRYVGHHFETRPDTSGTDRQAIVFELASEVLEAALTPNIEDRQKSNDAIRLPKKLTIGELRTLARTGESTQVKTRSTYVRQYYRSLAVKRYALARAKGICECCSAPAPFLTKRNEPYLEVHHLFRVADGGPDNPEGVAAICPTCHRNIHNGINGEKLNAELSKRIQAKEFQQ